MGPEESPYTWVTMCHGFLAVQPGNHISLLLFSQHTALEEKGQHEEGLQGINKTLLLAMPLLVLLKNQDTAISAVIGMGKL